MSRKKMLIIITITALTLLFISRKKIAPLFQRWTTYDENGNLIEVSGEIPEDYASGGRGSNLYIPPNLPDRNNDQAKEYTNGRGSSTSNSGTSNGRSSGRSSAS